MLLSDGEQIPVDRLLLCSGSNPHRPKDFPFDGDSVCTSDELWQWKDLPKSLMVVGEGVIACEFAFIFKSMGIDVDMLGMIDKPLPTMDQSISTIISREMKKQKIRFKGGKSVASLRKEGGLWQAYDNDKQMLASAERVLVCTGRVPNTEALDLQDSHIKCDDRGAILVDNFMQTSSPNIYAAGDVTGGIMLAHAASAQAKLAIAHMMHLPCHPYDIHAIPSAVFTTPEVAAVGLTEKEANDKGIAISVGTFDMRSLGKAHAMGEIAGSIKLIAGTSNRRLLGAHMVGANVTEIIHEAVLVISQQGSVDEILNTVHAHPTLSEAVLEAAEDIFDQACHKPMKLKREKQHVNT